MEDLSCHYEIERIRNVQYIYKFNFVDVYPQDNHFHINSHHCKASALCILLEVVFISIIIH